MSIPPQLDFRRLKAAVCIEGVLAACGRAEELRRVGHRLVGPCPIHEGTGPHSFVVDLHRDLWYCFSACSSGGDVVDLVRRLYRVGYADAARILARIAEDAPPNAPLPVQGLIPGAPSRGKPFRPFRRRLPLDHNVQFLKRKGIAPTTARSFEVGGWSGRGFLECCMAVRLHGTDGEPLGYAGRRLDHDAIRRLGKWKMPPGLPKSELLYNAHRVHGTLRGGAVVLVEGPWAVLRLHQVGIPAVSLLGTRLSTTQRKLLRDVARVVILMDGDGPGRMAAGRIQATISSSPSPVVVANLPDGADPDDLSDDNLRALLHPLLSS